MEQLICRPTFDFLLLLLFILENDMNFRKNSIKFEKINPNLTIHQFLQVNKNLFVQY